MKRRQKVHRCPRQIGEVRQDPGQDHRVTGRRHRLRSNAYFYDAAEGLLTSVVLLLAEFLPPDSKCPHRTPTHRVRVQLVQELLAPSGVRGKNWFALLMDRLPDAQGPVVCRCSAGCLRTGYGLGHEHGTVSPQRLSGL